MEKGYDVLLDYTYDYDILTYIDDDEEFNLDSYNFTILYSNFIVKKFIIEKFLYKELKKSEQKDINIKDKIFLEFESSKLAFKHYKNGFLKLAKKGYAKAVATYLFNMPEEERDEQIVKIAKGFEQLELKTPEQFEAIAALHYFDMINTKYGEIPVKDAGFLSIQNFYDKNILKYEPYISSQVSGNESLYFRHKILDTAYAKAIAKAQLGYYIKIIRNGSLKDVGNYFNINGGFNSSIVKRRVLFDTCDGLYLTNKQIRDVMYKSLGKKASKSFRIEEKLSYALAKLNISKNSAEFSKGIKLLQNIAAEPIIIERRNVKVNALKERA